MKVFIGKVLQVLVFLTNLGVFSVFGQEIPSLPPPQRIFLTPMAAPNFVDSAWTYDTLCIQSHLDSASRAALDTVSLDVAEWFLITTSDGLLPEQLDFSARYYAQEVDQKGKSYQIDVAQGYTKAHVIIAHELMHIIYQTVTHDRSYNRHDDAYFWNCKLMPDQYGDPVSSAYNDGATADWRLRTAKLW